MVKSYCVKQRKQTDCVAGSERHERAKNNRLMLKCVCAECGITKTRFVSEKTGGGFFDGLGRFLSHFDPSKTKDSVKNSKMPFQVDAKTGFNLLKDAFKPVDMKAAKKNYKNIKEAYNAYKANGGKLSMGDWGLKYGYAERPAF